MGYDEEGNAFTTLEGLKFQWSINKDHQKILEFITFKVMKLNYLFSKKMKITGISYRDFRAKKINGSR